jgi:uncharacterized protein YdeI (YjbR/CyaY-like superfamily)
MAKTDKRIDAYIAKSQPFAKPILKHLRRVVHDTCPECEETIKWGMPAFTYLGENMVGIAAFKLHAALGFWKYALLKDPKGILKDESMGSLGKITSFNDLPSDAVLKGFLKQAMKLNEQGIKVPKAKTAPKAELSVPIELKCALANNKAARAVFENFAPSNRREYIEWIAEARTDATRDKRIATALEWLAEGKRRNWKYER